jgi:histidine triad (HIT) family protein
MINMPDLTEEQRKEFEEKLKNMSPEELNQFQKEQCIFCQIISGKVPSKKVYDDNKCMAILDINPATRGHILILPKEHYSIMPQVPEEVVSHMFLVAKAFSQVLLKKLKSSGTNIFIANGLIAGQKAQHFMIHLIPRKEDDQLLNLEEKFIEPEMVKKVKVAVENKLNELLGIKKVIVEESQLEEGKEEKKDKTDKVKNKKNIDETNQDEESDSENQKENEEEEDDDEEETTENDDVEDDEEKNKKDEDQTDINLDDIANLFK